MTTKLKIVLTGGIASGKSSVGKMLVESGFIVIDADNIAHEALAKNVSTIAGIFGGEYIKNGLVDRKKLGSLVFSDRKSRENLERILHRDIIDGISAKVLETEKSDKPYIVDIPLFFERADTYQAELVAVVYASKAQQTERLMSRSHLSLEEARERIEAQMDIEIKKLKADIVIDNSMTLSHLKDEVDKFIVFIKDRYASQQI
jgi:dephospho-CoA kinase